MSLAFTPQELEALKNEIKTEILKEIKERGTLRIINNKPWDKVKALVSKRLEKFSVSEQYQVLTSISTIVRYSQGVKSIWDLSEAQIETAIRIANNVIDMIINERTKESEVPPCPDAATSSSTSAP